MLLRNSRGMCLLQGKSSLGRMSSQGIIAEEYLRRDREIRRAMERMATKDELRDVNATLRSIQESVSPHRR
jgi:hypothetical protein